ncbi:MAG TPA: TIGR01440 family protein [Bacillota bacterium]|nr:TIGR01440 family protein [Bacillota bacterium]
MNEVKLVEFSNDFAEKIKVQTGEAIAQIVETAKLGAGDLFVVGCSSSEICGERIGSDPNLQLAETVFDIIYDYLKGRGIYLAAQCCEHLNRALIVEAEAAERFGLEQVNVVPLPKAGGSFAAAAYHRFARPAAVESLLAKADAGLDIGDTMIGMHIRPVVVPAKIEIRRIGCANVVAARRRPKFVGGPRAIYDDELM